MTTGRRPRFDLDDLADSSESARTHDELPPAGRPPVHLEDETPPHGLALGSADMAPVGGPPDDISGWEWAKAVERRMVAIEAEARAARREAATSVTQATESAARVVKAETWNRRIVYALSALTTVAGTALVFAFTVTRAAGDAAGEKRIIDETRARYIATMDRLVIDVARNDGRIGALTDRLNDLIRARFLGGSTPVGQEPIP